jgi:hypothetical protein
MDSADLNVIDGAAGAWIRPRLGGEWGAVTLQVPKDFEAYARVLHPAYDAEWNPVTWAKVAEFCGTTPHREMQWHAISGRQRYEDQDTKWPGSNPSLGDMDIRTLDALCKVLAGHTPNHESCFFGLCTIQSWEDSFSKAELRGHPLLKLPLERHHIVLRGPLSAVDQIVQTRSDGDLTLVAFEAGSAPPTEDEIAEVVPASWRVAPNLIWPDDHSWLVASEVDFDSTLVGGTQDLINAIVKSPELEAWQVEPTDLLTDDADTVNLVPEDDSSPG